MGRLFINSNNEQYTEKRLQKMLQDISNEKNIGVNSLRSAYVTLFSKNQFIEKRTNCFLMRSSIQTLKKHYLKMV